MLKNRVSTQWLDVCSLWLYEISDSGLLSFPAGVFVKNGEGSGRDCLVGPRAGKNDTAVNRGQHCCEFGGVCRAYPRTPLVQTNSLTKSEIPGTLREK